MPHPRTVDEIDTPAVLVDVDRAEANIRRAQAYADAAGLALRPHIKTHKLPFFATPQVAAGAVGITCQKIGEAEVMADAGLTTSSSPTTSSGGAKLERLKALHWPRDAVGHRRQRGDAGRADATFTEPATRSRAGRMRHRHGPLRRAVGQPRPWRWPARSRRPRASPSAG